MRTPRLLLAGVVVLMLLALALPTLAAPPRTPPGQANKPDKSRVPEVEVSLHGRVDKVIGADGETGYTLTDDAATWQLDAGPKWAHGPSHPLEPFVGRDVPVTGTAEAGSTDVDVLTVDGQVIRAPGKPPWAGGWKRVGETHPGWSAEKAARMEQRFGDCFSPGQCKDKSQPGRGPEPDPTP
jgi:hypothetical protein